MSYFGEFKANGHRLIGAALGIGFGAALNHYMTNLFAPRLIAEFGWTKAEFALIGLMPLVSMLLLPLQGRFIDRYGSRLAAGIGVVILPITFVAYSYMNGSIAVFFTITFGQALIAMLVGTLAYTRVVVERFDAARGMALSLSMIGAPAIGAIMVPIVGGVVETEGWRAGYQLMALLSAVGGAAALILIGKSRLTLGSKEPQQAEDVPSDYTGNMFEDFRILAGQPAFLLILAGMLFCNFPQVLVGSQIVLMVMESGAPDLLATYIVSFYATGVIIGRLASGLALDRIPAHFVAIVALGLPAIGFLSLASPYDAPWVLGGAILLVGLAQGAEGGIGAYLTSRNFDMRQYSFVFSFLSSAMFIASASGAVLLSLTLSLTGSFNTFLVICSVLSILGALSFFLTGWTKPKHPELNEMAIDTKGPLVTVVGDEI